MVSKCALAVLKRKPEQNKLLWSRATVDTNFAKKILTVRILKKFSYDHAPRLPWGKHVNG